MKKSRFPERILILGGSGFIGSALVKRFRAEPGLGVRGLGGAALDLTAPGAWRRLRRLLNARTVLIAAASTRCPKDQVEFFLDEIKIGAALAKCLAEKHIRKCIYFSSISVYGDMRTCLKITEETPRTPTTFYGIAKTAVESLLAAAAARSRTPLLILRPAMVYGPGGSSKPYGPMRFIHTLKRRQKITLFGDGREHRDYLYVEDLAELTLRFALGRGTGVTNIAAGQSHSFAEIASCLSKVMVRPAAVVCARRKRPKVSLRIDPRKLRAAFPEFVFTPFSEGLRKTVTAGI